jgi:hydroxymethylpyrimidine pyrophosphatase-like HAD family hydrolase/GTPase SAR1 family protein
LRYLVLACDFDETLARGGRVAPETVAALERLTASGRKLMLVSGRELDDILRIFPEAKLCARIVAENGALIYNPATREKKPNGDPPPDEFIRALQHKKVEPLAVGHVIVATVQPHETTVLSTIRDLGLELQVIFNKGAVMILPAGVNKASGLARALQDSCISPHNVAAIGDAENDHALLKLAECAVAVANALPTLKERADFVTQAENGRGVVELIDEIVSEDLKGRRDRLRRHEILLGHHENEEIRIRPYGINLLVTGPSGSGKSTVTTAFLERLKDQGYQFCVIDPEGDYESFEGAVAVGNEKQPPNIDEVMRLLKNPQESVVVNLIGVRLKDRPRFFLALLPRLQEMRAQLGHPHWIVVDETHHVLPSSWEPAPQAMPTEFDRFVFITIHPHAVAPQAIASVNTVLAVGDKADETLANVGKLVGETPGRVAPAKLEPGELLLWTKKENSTPLKLRILPGQTERRRHFRKYAEGDLGPDRSFYFRGPQGKLKLQAQNLNMFTQLAEGVDDETWEHHLKNGDYARWFRTQIKDEDLASLAENLRSENGVSPDESRQAIRSAIEQKYTIEG